MQGSHFNVSYTNIHVTVDTNYSYAKFVFYGTKFRIMNHATTAEWFSNNVGIKIDGELVRFNSVYDGGLYDAIVFEVINMDNTIHEVEIFVDNKTTQRLHDNVRVGQITAIDIDSSGWFIDTEVNDDFIKALSNPTIENLDIAWNNIYVLENDEIKDIYFNALLDNDDIFSMAYDSTNKALLTKNKTDIINAVDKVTVMSVNNLYREDFKIDVNNLISEFNTNINTGGSSIKANYYTQSAKKFPTMFYINKANEYIYLMEDGEEKTALEERIYVLSSAFEQVDYIAVKIATRYVELSEIYNNASIIIKAQALVDNLNNSVHKTELQNRLNVL